RSRRRCAPPPQPCARTAPPGAGSCPTSAAIASRASRAPRSRASSRGVAPARSAISTARCCCSPPTPAASSRARPSWSTAARWWHYAGDRSYPLHRAGGRTAPSAKLKDAGMDFTLSPEIEDIRLRTPRFVEAHVLPLEADPGNYDDHENIRLDVLRGVQARAKAEGLWAPQAPKEYGGMELPIVGWAAMYEEANRSIFSPLAFNCAAPDDGNMNLLARVGTSAQKNKWLKPI